MENKLLKECLDYPRYINSLVNPLYQIVQKQQELLSLPIKKILLTGCGDSYFAAKAVLPQFQHLLTNIKVSVLKPLDFKRITEIDEGTLVIGISVSGGSAILKDVFDAVHQLSGNALLVTNNPQAKLAEFADYVLVANRDEIEMFIPGLISYGTSLIMLLSFAYALTNETDKYSRFVQEMEVYTQVVENYINQSEQLKELAERWTKLEGLEIVADGPLRNSAEFISAKFAEASGTMVTVVDSENYCHVNTFIFPRKAFATLVLMNESHQNKSRLLETIEQLRNERTNVLVQRQGSVEFKEPVGIYDWPEFSFDQGRLDALFNFLPGTVLSAYFAEVLQVNYFKR